MPILNVNQVQFNYELFGKGKDTIVFISGYTCDINYWRETAVKASETNRVLIFDNQGIGHTKDDGQPLDTETMATNICDLMTALQIDSAVLVGFAMGCCLALEVAKLSPKKVEKLVLLNPVVKWSHQTKQYLDELIALREQGEDEAMLHRLYELGLGNATKETLSKAQFADLFSTLEASQTLADQKRQACALKNFDASNWIGNLSVPTTVFAAKEDKFATLADGQAVATNLHGQCIDLACGHCGLLELPELTDRIVQACRQ